MKKIFAVLALSSVLAVPAFAQSSIAVSSYSAPQPVFGQTGSHLTRAQVKQELVDLESVGYNPLDDRQNYPNAIQAAQQRLWAKRQGQVAQTN